MGFHDFITSFLRVGGAPQEPAEITFEELGKRLEEELKRRQETFVSSALSVFEGMRAKSDEARQRLAALEAAELKNTKISPRELALMRGNRTSFIQMTRLFLDRIRRPERTDAQATSAFIEQFDRNLVLYNKGTKRSFHILNEFFAHETRAVGLAVKGIESLGKDLKRIAATSPEGIMRIQAMLAAIVQRVADTGGIRRQIDVHTESISQLKETIIRNEQTVKDLSLSEDFAAFKATEAEIDDERRSLKLLHDDLRNRFSSIEHALKKYGKISLDQTTIQEYLADPVKALMADGGLTVLEVLGKLMKTLESEQLTLKSTKRAKTLGHLRRIDQDYLAGLRAKIGTFTSNIERKSDILRKNHTYLRITELEEENTKHEDELSTLDKKIAYLARQAEKETEEIGALITEIKRVASGQLGQEITIRNPIAA
ncbi:hypothetical protein JXB02_00260 [Candidatus Woesearchaeota archaeon]|nr:hypothetical protein [Candidatus Woesearchaeota archaeon]